MTQRFDVAVIGAGIVGLAHAWMARRLGLRVALFDRSSQAQGASIRNFGMVWPIGQPRGELYDLALRSRDLWLQLAAQGVLELESCGSLHLAHRDDEWAVLQEFCREPLSGVEMLSRDEVLQRTNLANAEGLLGGMFSRAELRVDPRTASAAIAHWLVEELGVTAHFNTPVVASDGNRITASDGQSWQAERIIICSGSDLKTLFPEALRVSGLRLCKLQMLRAAAQPNRLPNTPHIASGLTLRHYASFRDCPSHQALCDRIAGETSELDRFGIHVMASQSVNGEVILGDSHEYDEQITPFDRSEIDELILRELHKVIRLEDWRIVERWNGVYAKHPQLPVFEQQVNEHVHVFVGTGGAGMTLSFGLAERAWNRWHPQPL